MKFPSEILILSYLERHPDTRGKYLKEKKITHVVAQAFSNKVTTDIKKDVTDVMTTNYGENSEFPLSKDRVFPLIISLLTKALKDCAEGKDPKLIQQSSML
jgi:hypothetical protein